MTGTYNNTNNTTASSQQVDCAEWDVILAQQDGWNEQACELDVEVAVQAAMRAIDASPEHLRFRRGTDIYLARKKQLATILESDLMLPSYSGAKRLHATMQTWCHLLEQLPALNAHLIEDEITLCENLCSKSKKGFMPNDRLVYVAYSQCNNKVSYGATFAQRLQTRLTQQKAYERNLKQEIADHVRALACTLSQAESRAALTSEQAHELLANTAHWEEMLIGLTSRHLYQAQIEELRQQASLTKPYFLARKKHLEARIAALQATIQDIDQSLEQDLAPLRDQHHQLTLFIAEQAHNNSSGEAL